MVYLVIEIQPQRQEVCDHLPSYGTLIFMYLLTPCSRVLLEKLTGSQLVKKFPAFYGTQRFILLILILPLALQPPVGYGLSNNTSPFVPIYHQLSPSSHSQHLKISFHFFSPSFPGSSSSSHPFQFLSEDLFGHPILLHSLQVTQPTYPLPLYLFYFIHSPHKGMTHGHNKMGQLHMWPETGTESVL